MSQPEPTPQIQCARCGQTRPALWSEPLQRWGKVCASCAFRNLFDFLELPTPASLSDRYSRIPTISDEAYDKLMLEGQKPKPRRKKRACAGRGHGRE